MLTSFLFTQQIAANAHKSNCSHHSMFAFAAANLQKYIWDRGKFNFPCIFHVFVCFSACLKPHSLWPLETNPTVSPKKPQSNPTMRKPTGFSHSSLVFAGVKSVENKAMQRKKTKRTESLD